MIVALGQTVRHFFNAVERFDLTTLRCDSRDPDWRAFKAALRALRKSIGYQIAALAASYAIPLQGELADYLPRMSTCVSSVERAADAADAPSCGNGGATPLVLSREPAPGSTAGE